MKALINKKQRPYNCNHWYGIDVTADGMIRIITSAQWSNQLIKQAQFNFCPKCGLDLRVDESIIDPDDWRFIYGSIKEK